MANFSFVSTRNRLPRAVPSVSIALEIAFLSQAESKVLLTETLFNEEDVDSAAAQIIRAVEKARDEAKQELANLKMGR